MATTTATSDPTFRRYTQAQAAKYANERGGYSKRLYEFILAKHTATGGRLAPSQANHSLLSNSKAVSNVSAASSSPTLLLDVGCGPGTATKDLAPFFDRAIGCDPGAQMVAAGTAAGYTNAGNAPVQFVECSAEELGKLTERDQELARVGEGEVDLMTCAMSAHWFDFTKFYPGAARLLRSGGTLAIWTLSSFYIDQRTTPNAKAVQAVLDEFAEKTLASYSLPGNEWSHHFYDNLPMPWDVNSELESAFPRSLMQAKTWNRGGVIPPADDEFFCGSRRTSLADLKAGFGTSSMVTRWRQANPDLVGTEKDCVEILVGKLRSALGTNEADDKTVELVTGMGTSLIILKKA